MSAIPGSGGPPYRAPGLAPAGLLALMLALGAAPSPLRAVEGAGTSEVQGEMPALPEGVDLPARPDFEGLPAPRREVAERVRHRIICYCGGCPKLNPGYCAPGCGTEKVLLAEIRALVDKGSGEVEAVAWFVDKYGEQILSAPEAKGFNLVAWTGPFVALIVSAVLLLVTLRRGARRAASVPGPAAEADPLVRERLRSEWDPFR